MIEILLMLFSRNFNVGLDSAFAANGREEEAICLCASGRTTELCVAFRPDPTPRQLISLFSKPQRTGGCEVSQGTCHVVVGVEVA